MSSQEIKQNVIDAFLKVLQGSWSVVAVSVALLWGWLSLDAEQVKRLHELEPLLNSTVGGWFAILIALSYIFSMIGKLREDVKAVFTDPVKEMIFLIASTKEEHDNLKATLQEIEKRFKHDIDKGEHDRGEIITMLNTWKPFFEGK